jgi:tetratricopeptide (TPR) repeat protein
VELQKQYGIRRELGVDPEVYDQQVAQIQNLMRLGKRTATFWLSLLQADDGRLETALGWLEKRVLDDEQQSLWTPAARYNLARLAEALGQTERAIELYKRVGETQEHGNRIRARLLAKASNSDQSS